MLERHAHRTNEKSDMLPPFERGHLQAENQQDSQDEFETDQAYIQPHQFTIKPVPI